MLDVRIQFNASEMQSQIMFAKTDEPCQLVGVISLEARHDALGLA